MSILRRAGRAALTQLESLVEQLEKSASREVVAERLNGVRSEARRELIRAVAAKRRAEMERARAQEQVDIWARRAELAVRSGDETLARQALQRKQAAGREAEQLGQLGAELSTEAQQMRQQLQRLEQRASVGLAPAVASSPERLGAKPGAESAVQEWEAVEQRIDDVELVLAAEKEVEDALVGGRLSHWELEAKFQELESGESQGGTRPAEAPAPAGATEIERELSELRSKYRV